MEALHDELWVSLWERVGREWKKQNWLRVIREGFLKAVWVSVRQKGEQGGAGLEEERVGLRGELWMSIGQCATRIPEPEWDPQAGSGSTWLLSSCPQDADGVFLSQMELEGTLESLQGYFCFLRHLYEEVRIHQCRVVVC